MENHFGFILPTAGQLFAVKPNRIRRVCESPSSFVLKSSLRADEIKLWLTPSAKQRRNPCSGLPAVYPDLSTRHDWPVKKGLCFVCRDRQSG